MTTLAGTIFGVAERGSLGILVYTYLRQVRGHGDYPPPLGSRDVPDDTITSRKLDGSELEVVIWDKLFGEAEGKKVLAELQAGRFFIPAESPVEPSSLIEGQPFGPIVITERVYKVRTSGAGLLRASGIALKDGVGRIRSYLETFMETGEIAAVLPLIFNIIKDESGLGTVYAERRRLSCVELFARADNDPSRTGPLFNVRLEKPGFRSKAPTRTLLVRREAAEPKLPYRLHVALSNFEELIDERLLEAPAGTAEITVEAPIHITNVELSVFTPDGQLADRISGSFGQGFRFALTAAGGHDVLPAVFDGAPDSKNLTNRPRVSTAAFNRPSAGDRSGGLDALRHNGANTAALIGNDKWKPENKWLRSSGEDQIEVIRWIKGKLEQPGIVSAFLIDPYLGSDAFRRIILRQGNQTIRLSIVVSPGGVNPDADTVDVRAESSHLDKLIATANDFTEQLCGQISVHHVKRGEGKRQAFHDRYLCLLDQTGVPTVYLLSNSLSKAAGDWPFAISELDRISSWRVYAYIQALIAGNDRDRELSSSVTWQSPEPVYLAAPGPAAANTEIRPDQAWKVAAERFLEGLKQAFFQSSADVTRVEAPLKAFLATWDSHTDASALAVAIFAILGHHQNVAVYISSLIAAGTPDQAIVGQHLDELLLKNFFELIPRDGSKRMGYLPVNDRGAYFENLAQTICRMPSPTDYARKHFNGVIASIAHRLEFQRSRTMKDWGFSIIPSNLLFPQFLRGNAHRGLYGVCGSGDCVKVQAPESPVVLGQVALASRLQPISLCDQIGGRLCFDLFQLLGRFAAIRHSASVIWTEMPKVEVRQLVSDCDEPGRCGMVLVVGKLVAVRAGLRL